VSCCQFILFSFPDDAAEILASHGITLLPDDSGTLDATGLVSDPARTFALTDAGKLALSGISNVGKTVSTMATTSAMKGKPMFTRIVRLNASGMSNVGQAVKTQTLRLATSGQISSTANAPKIIKVTPEQFAALKAGNY
jgi:hypothetical protein